MTKHLKKLISLVLTLVIILSVFTVAPISASAATTSQNNIVGWADYYYNITWTPQKSIQGWKTTLQQGKTYHIPYSQPIGYALKPPRADKSDGYIGFNISVDDFLILANDVNSVLYTGKSTYNITSTYYGMDCSSFVSACWGIARKITSGIPNVSKDIGNVNSSNVNKIQIGDALNSITDEHVVLVTDVTYNGNILTSVEITEQTPPELKRTTYSSSGLVSHYGPKGYKIHRYNGTVPTPPNTPQESKWYDNLVPVNIGTDFYAKITTSNHRDVCNSSGNVNLYESCDESNHVWYFSIQNDGSYKIKNAYGDNAYMDVYQSQDANVNVQIWSENYSSGQYWYIYTCDNEYYYLRPKCSDRVMDVYGGNNNIGDNIGIWTFNGTDAQKFKISKVPYHYVTIGDDFYAKIATAQGGLELSSTNGNVDIRNRSETPNHIWHFIKQEDNTYKIANMDNGVLDADGNIDANSNVQTWFDNGNDSQKWYIYNTGNQNSFYLKPKCADRVLDVSGANFTDGTNVGVFLYNKQENQQFKIDKILYPYEDIGTDFFAKITTVKNNYDVIANGGNVELGIKSNENNHIWFFKRNVDGSYKIKNLQNANSYMDVYDSKDENTNVIIWSENDGANQDWYIYKTKDGNYQIKTKSSNRYLDVIGGDNQVGDNVGIWSLSQSSAQIFSIKKLPPFNAKIALNKEKYNIEENIVITASADGGVDYYGVQIWKETEIVFSQEFIGHSIEIPAETLGVGTYGCFVSCVNSFGNVVTETVSFNVVNEDVPSNLITGDTNLDGTVSVDDVTYLQMHLARYTDSEGKALIDETNESIFAIADIDGDGMLTVSDATDLQMILAGYEL